MGVAVIEEMPMQTRKFVAYLSACVLAVALMCLVGCTAASGQKGAETPTEQSSGVPVVGTWQATRLDWKDPDKDDLDEGPWRSARSSPSRASTSRSRPTAPAPSMRRTWSTRGVGSPPATPSPFLLFWSSVILTGNQTNTADENSDIVRPDILFSSSIDTPEELAFYREFFSQEM